ncbi:related to cellular myosin heavy chain, type a [Cephalotrichum gorgonifer]|uniref:Related to cellular myosin heavy chain, type a n=1 Tax=Cephalotrichum gorgonifer TaxID=2041049 RepID=A0AAE8N7L0_9PEZI|nr:related to cellular myosin heavy chain, type a [Cephalotrichum gorgonifer]
MAPLSPSFLDRLSLSHRGPLLPLHSSRRREENGYDLDELDPLPSDGLLASPPPEAPYRRKPYRDLDSRMPEPPVGYADNETSPPQRPSSALFAGPPPPIARSAFLVKDDLEGSSPPPGRKQHQASPQNVASSLLNIGSVFFDSRRDKQQTQYQPPADSIWQSLRRREKAIENELQHVLDVQATALAGEPGRAPPSPAQDEFDGLSDAGSSTPTATFYSTASSKSKMMRSLNLPTKSTPDGNVIPVRQPTRSRRPGIRTARRSLLRSMTALADLKAEEDARVSSAVSQRKMALARLRKLAASKQTIRSELRALDKDEEEPLGKELRSLQSQRTSLTDEIKELEERLVGLRNKRRWVDGRIDDVRNRREAGLSGYKGALREVEADIDALVRHPSIRPLDRELWASRHGEGSDAESAAETSPGGEEFLRLIPERRTLDMARSWWESEIAILEDRRRKVERDREALEAGERLWGEVIDLVSNYEATMVEMMKGVSSTRKGKEKQPTPDDITRLLLEQMSTVVSALEEKLKFAEDKEWNLLICAVGAELDAFNEAERVLRQGLSPATNRPPGPLEEERERDFDRRSAATDSPVFKPRLTRANSAQREDSDNEVPEELLASSKDADPHQDTPTATSPMPPLSPSRDFERSDSENSVPPEFLAEHSDVVD